MYDESPKLDPKRLNGVERVIRGVMHYALHDNSTILPALSSIASEQANVTETNEKNVSQH